jgi:hypothetical protein
MGTNIVIYDNPESVNVTDPEATLTVYEMFIGVGPTGGTGPTGPAGADAVAGVLPSEYVEMTTVRTVTSGTLIDIPGVTADITLDSTVNIAVFMNCEISSDGACDLGLAISINGTDHDVVTTHLDGSSDGGKATVIHRTTTPLAAGTYTVKGRFLRGSGTATPQVDRADFLVFGLQGAKGTDSSVTIVPTADNDFILGTVAGAWETKTLAQAKTALGVTNAPNVATDATSDMLFGVANAWAKKTLAEGKTILGIPTAASAAEVTAGTEAGKFVTPDSLMNGVVHPISTTISNPQAWYTQRPQIFLKYTNVAITITDIQIACSDYSPGAELAGDLKFADDMNTGVFANATVIDVCDTTNGVKSITSGFDDATVPAGKFIYFLMDASPHADIKDFLIRVLYTVD